MRIAAFVGCCLLVVWIAPTRASDFQEAQQEVPDSAKHGSMHPYDPAKDPQVALAQKAIDAHIACVVDAIRRGVDLAGIRNTCVATRAAYAPFLPEAVAPLEIALIEQRLVKYGGVIQNN